MILGISASFHMWIAVCDPVDGDVRSRAPRRRSRRRLRLSHGRDTPTTDRERQIADFKRLAASCSQLTKRRSCFHCGQESHSPRDAARSGEDKNIVVVERDPGVSFPRRARTVRDAQHVERTSRRAGCTGDRRSSSIFAPTSGTAWSTRSGGTPRSTPLGTRTRSPSIRTPAREQSDRRHDTRRPPVSVAGGAPWRS
jgi:hypothetical protein